MGTRSRIGILEDGKFTSVYCHWDGYLENNGMILAEHYKDLTKVRQLINLGDISSLGEELGTKHDFDAARDSSRQCTVYGRDRGETGIEARVSDTIDDFWELCKDSCAEYVYVFFVDERTWYFSPTYGINKAPEFHSLDEYWEGQKRA